MNNSEKLSLIKLLLEYVVEKNRQEEDFMNLLRENRSMYDIDIYSKVDIPVYEMTKLEGKAEEIYNFLNRRDLSSRELVEEFCRKYKIWELVNKLFLNDYLYENL